ncbi:MAG: NAD(+) synthase [Lachnospiraceae bacterium]|nr:NAD(+) synthase [Lachnospiraceae bacterium]MCI9590470.1 NAD(+) synthase [Lachnospiraceae bacterium]
MIDGFIRVGAATPKGRVADPQWNREQMEAIMKTCSQEGVKILVFPELAITGYTCGDLFLQFSLIRRAKEELRKLMEASKGLDMVVVAGTPWEHKGKLYNTAAVIFEGELLGLIPKTHIPNYSEFYEMRYFEPAGKEPVLTDFYGDKVIMGANVLFQCENVPGLTIAAEICEDVWAPNPPSISHAMAGATVIVNCSASDETTGKDAYRRNLICGQSARLVSGYVYANAGEGESTQDLVFGGQNIIGENGTLLKESVRFTNETIMADLDLERIEAERRRMNTFRPLDGAEYLTAAFAYKNTEWACGEKKGALRFINPSPFVPGNEADRSSRCQEIFMIQAMGLKKRLEHTSSARVVLGLSGGLDSTLALLVCVKAFDMLGLPRNQIRCITMPCFGTTDRTYQNACSMAREVGAELQEIVIKEAVSLHFRDIGHDPDKRDVTYENSQARERTQVLMDIANEIGALVIGTGDMSELALGWATYNGDHMSMYGVNASVPKTLVRHLVKYYAETCEEKELSGILADVLNTPVSPELLPPKEGEIAQKTEDLVGPYELHDFFLYYILRFGYMPGKIYRMACQAFAGEYGEEVILKWLKIFYKRFFSQQFKRSCLPDGPKVGAAAISPRGDLRMPSDASARIWLEELERINL